MSRSFKTYRRRKKVEIPLKGMFLLVLLGITILLGACKPQSDLVQEVPELELIEMFPSTAVELEDSIHFHLFYRDGDGDLGDADPNRKNLFIIDNRINITYSFRIQALVPNNAQVPIQGQLEVSVGRGVITNGSTTESYTYTLYVIDRAGNESNRIESPAITLRKP